MAQIDIHHRFRRMLDAAEAFEKPWRHDNEQCFQYYDGDQWTEYEKQKLAERGQPPVVINLVSSTIDIVRSLEIQQRNDIQVIGREESDDNMATLLTALLKQVFDRCKFDYFLGMGFRDALIGGRGWLECKVEPDNRGREQIAIDYVPWEQIYVDPAHVKPDASDARFIIRVKWVDKDVVKKLFPDAIDLIDGHWGDEAYKGQEWEVQMQSSDRGIGKYYDHVNQRIKICQCWYTVPERKNIKVRDEKTGKETNKEVFQMTVHSVIFSDDIILEGSAEDDSKNPNTIDCEDLYPLVPLLCGKDAKGRPVGMVKGMIGIQDEMNKLNSKLIHKFGTRQFLLEKGAVDDPEEARCEIQRPDGTVILNDGGLGRIKVEYNTEDMGFITNHMQIILGFMQRMTGVNDSTLGIGGVNERSGVIQSNRIAQGASLHSCKLENISFCKNRIAYVCLRLIGKYYTDYRVLRVTQPNGSAESFVFNRPVIDKNSGETILHTIEDTLDYDVIFKHVPPFDSVRALELQIFSEVLKSGVLPPEIAGEVMLSLSDMPNKQDILRRLQIMQQGQQALQAEQAGLDLAAQQQAISQGMVQ